MLVSNNGPLITSTDYWDSKHADLGYFFVSFNAGAARLLVPDTVREILAEIQSASEVLLSRGVWEGKEDSLEILFEDRSEAPFSIYVLREQCDRLLPAADDGRSVRFLLYTREGLHREWPARFRIVRKLPCLERWA